MIERCNIQEEEEPSRSAPPVPRASIPADDSGVITTDGEGNIAITNTSDGSLDNADGKNQHIATNGPQTSTFTSNSATVDTCGEGTGEITVP